MKWLGGFCLMLIAFALARVLMKNTTFPPSFLVILFIVGVLAFVIVEYSPSKN